MPRWRATNAANPTIAPTRENHLYPGWKTSDDGPLRRWGSKYADRRSHHHAASATAKNPSRASRACADTIAPTTPRHGHGHPTWRKTGRTTVPERAPTAASKPRLANNHVTST